jgi:pimeloyl-ACP methyl ester carboxylesterase
MGAAVLCRVHQQAPEKVAALVSVDGLLCRPPGTPAEARALVGPFGSPQYLDHARGFISTFFPVPGTEGLRDRVMSEMLATPQHVMLGAMLGMFGPDQPDWILQKVNAPVMSSSMPGVRGGTAVTKTTSARSRRRSDYVVMDGAGHFLMLEKPAEFNATLALLLRKHDLIAK